MRQRKVTTAVATITLSVITFCAPAANAQAWKPKHHPPPTAAPNAVTQPPPAHEVDLTWIASTSTVTGYNIYRATVSGGPYTQINTQLIANTVYADLSVQAGITYYYVVTAVDTTQLNSSTRKYLESAYSNEASFTIPSP
jgi:fibronectin type 3 domain-containing protein